jgi:S-formylglutathione hydrolase FrmB
VQAYIDQHGWLAKRRLLQFAQDLAAFGRLYVPAIYGPSGDVKWAEADPTYSLDAARRGGGVKD